MSEYKEVDLFPFGSEWYSIKSKLNDAILEYLCNVDSENYPPLYDYEFYGIFSELFQIIRVNYNAPFVISELDKARIRNILADYNGVERYFPYERHIYDAVSQLEELCETRPTNFAKFVNSGVDVNELIEDIRNYFEETKTAKSLGKLLSYLYDAKIIEGKQIKLCGAIAELLNDKVKSKTMLDSFDRNGISKKENEYKRIDEIFKKYKDKEENERK